jgi:two-component system response regulator HydG
MKTREAVGDFVLSVPSNRTEFSIHSPSLVERVEDLRAFDFFLENQIKYQIKMLSVSLRCDYHFFKKITDGLEILGTSKTCIKKEHSQRRFCTKRIASCRIFSKRRTLNTDSPYLKMKRNILEALNKTNNNKTETEAAKLPIKQEDFI